MSESPVYTAGMPASHSASIAGPRVLVALDDHRDVARLERSRRRTWRRWPAVHRCRRPGLAGCACADRRSRSSESRCSRTAPGARPAAGTGRRTGRPRAASRDVRLDVVHDDPRVAELRAAQHRLQAVHQRGVAAPVLAEGLSLAGGLRGLEVRDDVAAAERVDGLLRVADQDQRRAAGERAVDHLPLHRVGVLELVDHHDRPSLMHPQLRGRVVGLQRVGQPGEQVVVAEDAEPALADFQFGQNVFREVDADRGARLGSADPSAAAPSPGA